MEFIRWYAKKEEKRKRMNNEYKLTKMQLKVLSLMAKGMTNKEIALSLNRKSVNGIISHITHIYQKYCLIKNDTYDVGSIRVKAILWYLNEIKEQPDYTIEEINKLDNKVDSLAAKFDTLNKIEEINNRIDVLNQKLDKFTKTLLTYVRIKEDFE